MIVMRFGNCRILIWPLSYGLSWPRTAATHNRLVTQFDWDRPQVHREVGYRLLRDFAPSARLADRVHFHHTRWDKPTWPGHRNANAVTAS